MPGITTVLGAADDEATDSALESVRFLDRYERRVLHSHPSTLVACTGYPSYPVRSFESDGRRIVLEGHLYDVDDVAREVERVATALVDGDGWVSEWVADRDGEFLLVVAEDDRLWVLNDQFGRLPTYHAAVGDAYVVSRELGFVREFARRSAGELDVDALGAGQMMLLGYPLGTRTLFEGVELLPPGSLLRADGEDVDVERLHQFDVSGRAHADRTVGENAAALRSLFAEACANRASVSETSVVALSGGLDSRAVLAGYDAVDGVSVAATSVPPGYDSDEGRVAEQVADRVGVEWREYVIEGSDRHRADLLRMAQGMNHVGNAAGLAFSEAVAADYPGATLVTGDGGDKVLPDVTPAGRFVCVDELVQFLVSDHQRLSVADAAAINGVDPAELEASIRARFESYPESSLEDRYVRFLVRERGINWLNHGEDRTRNHMWSTTPFYSPELFRYAMQCPQKQKRRYRLYREFLSEFSSDAVEVEYVNFGAPLDSMEYQIKQFGYELLSQFPGVKTAVVDLLTGDGPSTAAEATAAIDGLLDDHSSDGAFDARRVRRVLREGNYGDTELYMLYTVLAAVQERSTAHRPAPA